MDRDVITLSMPPWAAGHAATYTAVPDVAEQMRFVIAAAQINVDHGDGGPFAAAVFEEDTGELVALGVNLVTRVNLSVAHAEVVALSLAQRRLGTYDLGASDLPAHRLVTSTEPCAMCFGAIPWSGVRHVVTGARDADARAIGFDEGPKRESWIEDLRARGIAVTTEVEAELASQVLRDYAASGGTIYNSREG